MRYTHNQKIRNQNNVKVVRSMKTSIEYPNLAMYTYVGGRRILLLTIFKI
jgi:hypothetical protein